MDKTIPPPSSLTAWVGELLNGDFILLNGMVQLFQDVLKRRFAGLIRRLLHQTSYRLQMRGAQVVARRYG